MCTCDRRPSRIRIVHLVANPFSAKFYRATFPNCWHRVPVWSDTQRPERMDHHCDRIAYGVPSNTTDFDTDCLVRPPTYLNVIWIVSVALALVMNFHSYYHLFANSDRVVLYLPLDWCDCDCPCRRQIVALVPHHHHSSHHSTSDYFRHYNCILHPMDCFSCHHCRLLGYSMARRRFHLHSFRSALCLYWRRRRRLLPRLLRPRHRRRCCLNLGSPMPQMNRPRFYYWHVHLSLRCLVYYFVVLKPTSENPQIPQQKGR